MHHSSCISRSLCDPSLLVHTDSPLRCSQILAVALASHLAPSTTAQQKHTRAPAHTSAHKHTHKDEHGHAQLRRSTLGGHKYRAVHMHTLEQGGVGEWEVAECCAPEALLLATDVSLSQVAALSCCWDGVWPPMLNVCSDEGWMHGQVNVQQLGRSIHGSAISVQEAE